MRGLFVTGTDTGVGKTVLSASLTAAMTLTGEPVRPFKPVLTGLEEPAPVPWGRDDELLARAAGLAPQDVCSLRFKAAASPHLAAAMENTTIDPGALVAAAAAHAQGTLLVEGVGGLLVPLHERYLVIDLADELGLPLVIAARPGLGTINHTLLTVAAARARGLSVAAVVLTPWQESPSELELSNRVTIQRLGDVPVEVLPLLPDASVESLAAAGGSLPWPRWLAPLPLR
jgi:dethiobiotin synthetase